jgi:hypothetical protein
MGGSRASTTKGLAGGCDDVAKDVGGLVVVGDGVDQDGLSLGVVEPVGENLGVGFRPVPGTGVLSIGEFDDDQIALEVPFAAVEVASVDKKATVKRGESCVDLLEVLDDLGAKFYVP